MTGLKKSRCFYEAGSFVGGEYMENDMEHELRSKVIEDVKNYCSQVLGRKERWKAGDRINYGGRCFDQEEVINLVNSALDFWLTSGRFSREFESEFCGMTGTKYCMLTNSGSSANLLAFMALTSHELGDRRIEKNDEVITAAAGFPTTVAPIIQYGAVPVFVDISIPSYNIDVSKLQDALSEKTKAVIIAHTLGNPFNLCEVNNFCSRNNLWLIEDNCDALGARYFIDGQWKYTGTIGDMGTSSFYPPHHITMGEGGAVYTDNPKLKRIIESFRDWGRDCWCSPGCDNTCQNRFNMQYGEMPFGYDHKYIYSHLGYNLKITDMQASIGCAQLRKLPFFIEKRNKNWSLYRDKLSCLEGSFIMPEAEENSIPSWFGFMLTIKDGRIKRRNLLQYLESKGIQTRLLFAGNIIKQPCFDEFRKDSNMYKTAGCLENTDTVMNNSFWLGVYPEITEEMIDYICNEMKNFVTGAEGRQ